MVNRDVRGRAAALWAAGFLAGLLMSVAPSCAYVSEPVHDQPAAAVNFGLSVYDDAALAPFTAALPRAPEPFRAELGSSGNVSLDAKWRGVKKDLHRDQAVLQHCRDDISACPPAAGTFLAIIDRAQSRSGWSRIAEVNRSINLSIRPVSDMEQYGVRDLWATPLQMFTSHAGDCEDLAIAKYAVLRELGYTENDLRLVIVNDKGANEIHAVAAVRHEGRWLVLDNRTLEIRNDTAIAAFDPLFMIGGTGVHQITALSPKPENALPTNAPWTMATVQPQTAYVLAGWPMMSPAL